MVNKPLEEFQEIGGAYQRAHSLNPKNRIRSFNDSEEEDSAQSMQAWKISVHETMAAIEKLVPKERRSYVSTRKLCFNCLKPKHQAKVCRSKSRCSTCGKKHHSLLHFDVTQDQTKEKTKSSAGDTNVKMVASFGQDSTRDAPGVLLMTAVVDLIGRDGKRHKARAFFDQGSQASFVAEECVRILDAPKVKSVNVTIQGFTSSAKVTNMSVHEVALVDCQGTHVKVNALKRGKLDINIPSIPMDVMKRWRRRGIELSDSEGRCRSPDIQLLIGADYANSFLKEKTDADGESAWRTSFGWVLSGPCGQPNPTINVNYVQSSIETLWQMEAPTERSSWPAFPMDFKDGTYTVGFLWKSEERPADNRAQAFAVANSQLRSKLSNGSEARKRYDAVLLSEYGEIGAIEMEPSPEEPGYYMPHHAVFRQEALTTKTRVVFNASAASHNRKSLNGVLDPGPSLMPNITGLLLRFRIKPIALHADIRKAFFTISVRKEDRKFLRFLWPNEEGKMTTYRLARLPFGVNCSPFIMTAVLQHHLHTAASHAILSERDLLLLMRDSFYVDDNVASLESEEEAAQYKELGVSTLKTAGMELRKWRSNSQAHRSSDQPQCGKVLGATWSSDSDLLSFPIQVVQRKVWTKRKLLQSIALIFDPIGLISPYIIRGKVILQKLWIANVSWDEPLAQHFAAEVEQWWGEVDKLQDLTFPRWIGSCTQPVMIHLFSDASEQAYGCAIYVTSGHLSTLLCAKAKVAPVRAPTLARLELQAAFMGSKLLKFAMEESRIQAAGIHSWTDSMTVRHWIRQPPHRWKTFVGNRVSEIQNISHSLSVQWHHCPGAHNPADIPSRGSCINDLQGSKWKNGPLWLPYHEEWPSDQCSQITEAASKEVRTNCNVVLSTPPEQRWWVRLSKWTRILGVVRRMLTWKYKDATTSTFEIVNRAEQILFRIIQNECFQLEVNSLKAGRSIPRGSRLLPFRPFLDGAGLLRATRRLELSDLDEDSKHPIILADHFLTALLMTHIHQGNLHLGVEGCVAASRRRFAILRCRRLFRKIKQQCTTCRRFDSEVATEVSPPLPEDRVTLQRPFSVVGVDHAGPLMVKNMEDVRKAWLLLFVCATTRAVNLHLVRTMSMDDVILAYRVFVARNGVPRLIRSDNGPAFVAASKQISVEWKFNPPASPWHGGFYERLVGIIKSPLRKVLRRSLLSFEEMRTTITEVETVVNNRPLTYVGTLNEPMPLTPSMLLGRAGMEGALEKGLLHAEANRRVKYLAELQEHLSHRWKNEYLLALRLHSASKRHELSVGDVVLLKDEKKHRQSWKMAKVTKLFPGQDGLVRIVRILVGDREFLRPIQKLIPLELKISDST